MSLNQNDIAAIGIFAGLACAGGYLFIAVPNVEVFTATIFLSGVLLGPRNGAIVGGIAATVFGIFNPMGISPTPLLAAQILCRALTGLAGGLYSSMFDLRKLNWANILWLGVAGLVLTWLYDVLSDLSFFFISGFTFQKMKVVFAGGVPFYLIHGVVNTAIFVTLLPFAIRGARKAQLFKMAN